jgi:excisionase family DNA binding protein
MLNNEEFYTPEEVASQLKLSLTTVYKLIKSNELPSIRLGKCYRLPASHLARLIQQQLPRSAVFTIPKVAQAFIDQIKSAPPKLQERLTQVILFGSHARGESHAHSDVDLLILHQGLTPLQEQGLNRMATEAMATVDYQDVLSLIRKSEKQWQYDKEAQAGLYQNITREGIVLWDPTKQTNSTSTVPKRH